MKTRIVSSQEILGPCPNGHKRCFLPRCWVKDPTATSGGWTSREVVLVDFITEIAGMIPGDRDDLREKRERAREILRKIRPPRRPA